MQNQIDAGKQHHNHAAPVARLHGLAESAPLPPVLQLQQQAGNQAVQDLLRAGFIRAKLAISHPDDPEEREADQVAHTIMRAHAASPAPPCSCGSGDEMCEECQQQSPAPIQRHASAPETPTGVPQIVRNVLGSSGQPLDAATRDLFEPWFGHDFSDVRIHTGSEASASARSINAHAYTAGRDIVFASNQYSPNTTTGRILLAHELTHTVQHSTPDSLHRDDGDGGGSDDDSGEVTGDWEVFDPQDPAKVLDYWTEQIDADADDSPGRVASKFRFLLLLLKTATRDWKEWFEFDEFRVHCENDAADEKLTLTDLGDANLDNQSTEVLPAANVPGHETTLSLPEAFPETWAEKLAHHLKMVNAPQDMASQIDRSRTELQNTGREIPTQLFDHGIPVGFPSSTDLETFYLSNAVGVAVLWSVYPGLPQDPPNPEGPLLYFQRQAGNYLRILNTADFVAQWTRIAEGVVQDVREGQLAIDFAAFMRYAEMRPAGVPWESASTKEFSGIAKPQGTVDPARAEEFVTSLAGLVMMGQSLMHAAEVAQMGNQLVAEADSRVASENPLLRGLRAERWGHERGFYEDALLAQWEDIKAHAVEIGVGMAKDVAKYAILESIPIVNIATSIYLAYQLFSDAADTIGDLMAADKEAEEAVTAAALQRAAAHKAVALSSAARKVATAIAMHKMAKAAEGLAGEGGGKVEGEPRETEPADTAKDRAAQAKDKVEEGTKKQDQSKEERGTSDPDTTAKPGDFTPEQLAVAKARLAERINDPQKVRNVEDPNSNYDLEVDLEDGQTYKRKKDGTWCLSRNPMICGTTVNASIAEAAEKQKLRLDTDDLINLAIEKLEQKHKIDHDKIPELREHLRANPEELADIAELQSHMPEVVGQEDIPAAATGPRGGSASGELGKLGKDFSRYEARTSLNETWVADELTFTVTGPDGQPVTFIADMGTISSSGEPRLIDAKLGPGAGLEKPQEIGYPIVSVRGAVPKGPNAERFAQRAFPAWRPGQATPPISVRIEYWTYGGKLRHRITLP